MLVLFEVVLLGCVFMQRLGGFEGLRPQVGVFTRLRFGFALVFSWDWTAGSLACASGLYCHRYEDSSPFASLRV